MQRASKGNIAARNAKAILRPRKAKAILQPCTPQTNGGHYHSPQRVLGITHTGITPAASAMGNISAPCGVGGVGVAYSANYK